MNTNEIIEQAISEGHKWIDQMFDQYQERRDMWFLYKHYGILRHKPITFRTIIPIFAKSQPAF